MKLGILCTMINGFGRRGFYNTQEIGLGRSLARMGHRVVIYKCLKHKPGMTPEKVVIGPDLVIKYLPAGGLGAHGYLPAKVLAKDLDGLLCFSDNQVFLPHIFRYCKKQGIVFVPYVGTTFSLHGGLHGWAMDAWFAAGTRKIYRRYPVLAKTEGAKRELTALGAGEVSVAPVGLDTAVLKEDFKSWDRDGLRRDYGFAPDDVILCDVARLEAEKRPQDMIDIFLKIRGKKKFKLLLIGEGPLEGEVKERIAALGLDGEVRHLKRIPYDEMWKIYAMSDYFISLNRGEIFGMAIMEAVYYGTACAAFAGAPGPSTILKDMEGHFLYENDGQLAQWLMAPYPDKRKLEESAQKAPARFSWDACARAFSEIVERRRPR